MVKLITKYSKLNEIVQASLQSPLYQWRFPQSVSVPRHFEDFPVTRKEQLYHGYEHYIFNKNKPSKYRQSVYLSPSGSCGEYVNVSDYKENELQRDLFASFITKYDVLNNSFIFGNLFGGTSLYRGLDVTSSIMQRCNSTSIPFERFMTNDLVYKYLQRFCANGIAGMPPRLMSLCEYLNDNNLTDLCLPNILFAGEQLTDTKLNILQDTITCNNIIGLYGSAECGVFAVQNESVFNNKYYYYDPNMMHVEVEPDTNELIVTSLVKYRYPLIRYNTKDRGNIIEVNDEYGVIELCGRNELAFSIGADYYDLQESGKLLTFLNQFIEFQIIINTDENGLDHLLFLLVDDKDKKNTINVTECEHTLKQFFYGYGDKDIGIKCNFCEISELRISKTSGKIKPIIDLRG